MRSPHSIFLAVAWFCWMICPWYATDPNIRSAPAWMTLVHPISDDFCRPPDASQLCDGATDESATDASELRPAWLCFAVTTAWCVFIAIGNDGWPLTLSQKLMGGPLFLFIAVLFLPLVSIRKSDE